MRRTEYLSELRQDVVFACRQLLKSPGFTLVALLTLTLGLGATTAIFSAVHAVVLQPLPFPDADRVVSIYETWRGFSRGRISAGNFVSAISKADSFSHVTVAQYGSFNLGDESDTERVIGASVSGGFFDVFNVPPALGRVFTQVEDHRDANRWRC